MVLVVVIFNPLPVVRPLRFIFNPIPVVREFAAIEKASVVVADEVAYTEPVFAIVNLVVPDLEAVNISSKTFAPD